MKLFLLYVASFFAINAFSQNPKSTKTSLEKAIDAGSQIINSLPACQICSAKGKLDCTSCSSWSKAYKDKVPCHTCKDTRKIVCKYCNGTGKFVKKNIITSQEELDEYIDQNQSISSQYPARPVQSNVIHVEINEDQITADAIKRKEDENSTNLKEIEELKMKVEKLKQIFRSDSFGITLEYSNSKPIKVKKLSSGKCIYLSSYKIENGFVILENGFIYNKNADLVFSSEASCSTFKFDKGDGNIESYMYTYYENYIIIANYKGEVLLHGSANVMNLFTVLASDVIEEFNISKYKNEQLIVARFMSTETTDLANIQYHYQVINLADGSVSNKLNLQSLKSNIKKIQKANQSIIGIMKDH